MKKMSVWPAVAVHFLTSLGTICALLAFQAASNHAWETAFAWLGLALVIDGIDGPIARKISIETRWPRVSGERLDLIIDYLNYVAVPAFIMVQAQLIPEGFGILAGSIILISSLYHFADQGSKTSDCFFVGFPAIWNVIIFYFFAFSIPPVLAFMFILFFAVMTFVPLKWSHPFRVLQFRPITLPIMMVWGAACIWTLAHGFPGSTASQSLLAIGAIYFLGLGALRSLKPDS